MLSLNDLFARFNPDYRLRSGKIQLDAQIAAAKIQQKERHHAEMLEFQRQKAELEQQTAAAGHFATLERERIAGRNALALGVQQFILSQLEQNSAILNAHHQNHLERRRDWGNNIAAIRKSLFEIEADTIRQKALSRQEHKQAMERMRLESKLRRKEQKQSFDFQMLENQFRRKQDLERLTLEYNLKFLEAELNHHIHNRRVTYDGLNAILMRLIERVAGVDEQINGADVERFVDEAMAQAYR